MKRISILLLLALCSPAFGKALKVSVKNSSNIARSKESVVVDWSKVESKLKNADPANVVVFDADGNEVASQVIYNGKKTPQGVLFQVDIDANSKEKYKIKSATKSDYPTQTFGRFVPERKDDFAWENDKIAFRMYGPALEATGEISNGIDIWVKGTSDLVINKWYSNGYNYHKYSKEGLDCYKVGPTLGCGATVPFSNGKLVMSKNYTSYKILDSGALRIKFELRYAPFLVDGKEVTQVRVITLDAATNLNSVECYYEGDYDSLEVVTGVITRGLGDEKKFMEGNILAYKEPSHKVFGTLYGAVITSGKCQTLEVSGHIAQKRTLAKGEKFTYLAGGYWSGGGVENYDSWLEDVKLSQAKFNSPLTIK